MERQTEEKSQTMLDFFFIRAEFSYNNEMPEVEHCAESLWHVFPPAIFFCESIS